MVPQTELAKRRRSVCRVQPENINWNRGWTRIHADCWYLFLLLFHPCLSAFIRGSTVLFRFTASAEILGTRARRLRAPGAAQRLRGALDNARLDRMPKRLAAAIDLEEDSVRINALCGPLRRVREEDFDSGSR